MKIDRLIGILSILLQREKVTAPELAQRFEVSRRTISRDIEDLCKAGIPLITRQGSGGGISIAKGYKIDKTLLTSSELQSIQAGLQSLDSISGTRKYKQLMEKLTPQESVLPAPENHILIDLSSYYKASLSPKIEEIQRAIAENRILSFTYYSPKGESKRTVEPRAILYQWSSWYLRGYCLKRNAFRTFKLNRLRDLMVEDQVFTPREDPDFTMEMESVFPNRIHITALFQPGAKWRLIEEYGMESFTAEEDGRLLFTFGFSDRENLFSWLLSFGDQVELVEPAPLRKEFSCLLTKIQNHYSET